MTISFNHTIVWSKNNYESAAFLTDLFGLPAPQPLSHFQGVEFANGATLDYATASHGDEIRPQHYAFLVSEDEFDDIYARIQSRGMDHWADPQLERSNKINHNDGGRGVYFLDPSGHIMEIITRPYGG